MLKKLAPYTRGYGLYILLGVLCSVGEAVLELELPQAMSDIVDVGIASGDRRYIMLMGLKMLVLALLALGGLPAALAWGFGGALLLGRVLHALGLSRGGGYSFGRFWGTALTWLVFLLMALAGLWLALR